MLVTGEVERTGGWLKMAGAAFDSRQTKQTDNLKLESTTPAFFERFYVNEFVRSNTENI